MANEASIKDAIGKVEKENFELIPEAQKSAKWLFSTAKKQREHYFTFGKAWLKFRELTNGNVKMLSAIRKELFSNKNGKPMIDAQTASYSALMVELWENEDYPLKDFATDVKPNINNPRPLVQEYRKWVKEEDIRKKAQKLLSERKQAGKVFPDDEKALKDITKALKSPNPLKNNDDNSGTTTPADNNSSNDDSKHKTVIVRKQIESTEFKGLESAQICEAMAKTLNNFISAMNDGKIAPENAETLIKYLDNTKKKINQYIASGDSINIIIKEAKTEEKKAA